jgi:hypothetical protein
MKMKLFLFFFRVELLDYLDSIDCSLEDFQAMLSGRQFSIDPDLLVDVGIFDTLYCTGGLCTYMCHLKSILLYSTLSVFYLIIY